MDISNFRHEYLKGGLEQSDLLAGPVEQFDLWFNQAKDTDIPDPNAMILSTVSSEGQPSQRTVLLKYYDEDGFVFLPIKRVVRHRKLKETQG